MTNNVDKLESAIHSIKDKYAKYLSVFYYFDPNSLGTISEILLSKLVNLDTDLQSQHTGASGGLTDVVIDGISISLKTTAEKKAISLGSDEIGVPKGTTAETARLLKRTFNIDHDIKTPINLTDPVHKLLTDSSISDQVKKNLENRIDSIAKKLAGPDDKEMFVWVEKKYDKNQCIVNLTIHITDYQYLQVKDRLLNAFVYFTDRAWGLKDENGKILVQPDNTAKALNIMPDFVYLTLDKKTISIDLPAKSLQNQSLTSVKTLISTKLFNALDDIYSSLN